MSAKEIRKFLDPQYVKRNTSDPKSLKVTVKKHKIKGAGLFATKKINRGNVIAYYRMTVFDIKTYKSPTKNMYTFTILTPKGNFSRSLIGDLSLESLPGPCRNIPFWAYFSNEPSEGEEPNAMIDMNQEQTYRNRKKLRAGDTIVYKLRATRTIQPGQEVLWCYGDAYERNYLTPCASL